MSEQALGGLPGWAALLLAGAYLSCLFAVAWWGDRRGGRKPRRLQAGIWTLALAVYATSWTYYGAVGGATQDPYSWFAIYLGPVLMFTIGLPVLKRVIQAAKDNHVTSMADFIASRYGGDTQIGSVVTLVAVLAVLPYIAVQLKSVVTSLETLAPSLQHTGADVALLTAAALGFFAVLFGTRHVAASEKQYGLVLAVAFESVVKLAAFLLVGAVLLWQYSGSTLDLVVHNLEAAPPIDGIRFVVLTVLAAMAVLCLPRQFHLLAVESGGPEDLSTARWLLPLYLLLVSVLVLPLAAVGQATLGATVDSDSYLLALPIAQGQELLASLAFIGGFSAASAMVILACIALAIMISNEWVMPRLLRSGRWPADGDLGALLRQVRRFAIAALLLASYLFYRAMAVKSPLAATGEIAFVGVAQLAPALLGALYWRGGNHLGVMAGLMVGTALWAYTLLIPGFLPDAAWIQDGPAGIIWLAPHALFGLVGLDPLVHGSVWSLGSHILLSYWVSRWSRTSLREQLNSHRFVRSQDASGRGDLRYTDLKVLIERFYGADRARSLLAEFARHHPDIQSRSGRAPPELLNFVERRLAAVMGSSSARSLLDALESGSADAVREVARAIDQASGAARFNRDLLQATLDNLSQAVSVIDAEQRLVAWNRAYEGLFNFPAELLAEGAPIEDILRYNAQRGLLGDGDAEDQVQRRLEHLRQRHRYRHERRMPDGRVLEVRGEPMPGGGFVSTFSDVTDYKHVQEELERTNVNLEQRVAMRTAALEDANTQLTLARAEAETANRSKTRFLAAAGHDLMQPLNAAKLFVASAQQHTGEGPAREELLGNAEQALHSMEGLLTDLLDISRLDAGVWEVKPRPVSLEDVLLPLEREFGVIAAERGLQLRVRQSRGVVVSDPQLLRRILQNLLSNAIRYTEQGKVLMGVRRRGTELAIEVWDTGPGIAPEHQQRIFEEFSRLQSVRGDMGKGFGLGLAICLRMAKMLNHRIEVESVPGRGSCFRLLAERTTARRPVEQARSGRVSRGAERLRGVRALCIDDDAGVLAGMRALLETWGCTVETADTPEAATATLERHQPQILLADYQLGQGRTGVEVVESVRAQLQAPVPAILITADVSSESAEAARRAHMRVLHKPVRPAALRALMSGLL